MKDLMQRRREAAAEPFNRGRVEVWQTQLAPGDLFAAVYDSLTVYCRVLPFKPDDNLPPHIRRVAFFSEDYPEGRTELVHISAADLPLTEAQFAIANATGWPSDSSTLRALVGMQRPALA